MRLLVIDDDKVFTEPLVWLLERAKHTVVYCQEIGEVLDGWYEINAELLDALRNKGTSNSCIKALESLVGERFRTRDEFARYLTGTVDEIELAEHDSFIFKESYRSALEPKPDCILLDIMMPCGDYYSKQEVGMSKATGARLLRDIVERIGVVPVVVVTVRNVAELHSKLREEYQGILQEIIVKPVTPVVVMKRLEIIFPGQVQR